MKRAPATTTARATTLEPIILLAPPVKGVTLPGEYASVPLALGAEKELPVGPPVVAVPLFAGNGAELGMGLGCTGL